MQGYEDYGAGLAHYNAFMRPIYVSAVAQARLPTDGVGLDMGCGIGGLFALLPPPFIGYDRSRPHLKRAQAASAIPLVEGNLHHGLPFRDESFAWVWASDALLMHQFPDPWASVGELARVTRGGGRVALFFEHSWRGALFPGQPQLEALFQRILYQLMPARDPRYHADNAHVWLTQAGLRQVQISAQSALYRAPLSPSARHYLTTTIFGWIHGLRAPSLAEWGVSEAEWRALQEATSPTSPRFVLDDPDYYCIRLATVAVGDKPTRP